MSLENKENWKLQAIAAGGLLAALTLITLSIGKTERRRTLEDLRGNLYDTQQGFNYVKKQKIPKSDVPKVGTLNASIKKLKDELQELAAQAEENSINMVALNRIDKVDALMANIVTSAQDHKFQITRIQTPTKAEKNGSDFFMSRESRSMEIVGAFPNLIHFLEDFHELDYTVLVQALTIQKMDSSNYLSIELQLLL